MARCRRSRGRPTDGGWHSCAPAAAAAGGRRAASRKAPRARRRKRPPLKPRVPSRVKRRRRATKKAEGRGHQHPELIGLVLVALGVFLGLVVWAGWSGGYVGGWVGDGLDALIGSATLGLPAALVIVGALVVARSDRGDVRPFRTGLVGLAVGRVIT